MGPEERGGQTEPDCRAWDDRASGALSAVSPAPRTCSPTTLTRGSCSCSADSTHARGTRSGCSVGTGARCPEMNTADTTLASSRTCERAPTGFHGGEEGGREGRGRAHKAVGRPDSMLSFWGGVPRDSNETRRFEPFAADNQNLNLPAFTAQNPRNKVWSSGTRTCHHLTWLPQILWP